MLADSLIVPNCIYRPGSFSGLMTLYESNFLKLESLLGHTYPQSGHFVSSVPADCELHLEVVERERYTSTLTLTYWFDVDGRNLPDPDLEIRVYHDASLVEGVAWREHHRHHVLAALARTHIRELDRRWRINMMLNKWLDYLLDKGHKFG